jgi:2'-5' RNA ligase
MSYALVHYPAVDTALINSLRRKYDPQIDLVEPHLTIVFPIPETIGEQTLVLHFEDALREWKPFAIHLGGVQQSRDHYIFLLVQKGKADLIRMHEELYTGVLAAYRQEVLHFVPHVTLGSFTEGGRRCLQALEEAERLGLDYQTVVDRLHLVKINSDRSQIIWTNEFLV